MYHGRQKRRKPTLSASGLSVLRQRHRMAVQSAVPRSNHCGCSYHSADRDRTRKTSQSRNTYLPGGILLFAASAISSLVRHPSKEPLELEDPLALPPPLIILLPALASNEPFVFRSHVHEAREVPGGQSPVALFTFGCGLGAPPSPPETAVISVNFRIRIIFSSRVSCGKNCQFSRWRVLSVKQLTSDRFATRKSKFILRLAQMIVLDLPTCELLGNINAVSASSLIG